jgi:hypothetical protein
LLGDFHQQAKSNGKACHATYILSGFIEESIPANPDEPMQLDGDDYPMSSPPPQTQESSKSNGAKTKMIRTITLADEDDVHGNHKTASLIHRSESQIL